MSVLDYRSVEYVDCAGISITTFLSEDRNIIMVSATDLVDHLSLDVGDLKDLDKLYHYVIYDIAGRQADHYCITHEDINEFIWMHSCSKEYNSGNLDEFRKYFSFEVMNFWKRFAHAAASLSVRDALNVITKKIQEYQDELELPSGRVYQFAFESLGYETAPRRESLTTEELAFVSFTELLYASVAAAEQLDGQSPSESFRLADKRLEGPLIQLGQITRGIGEI